MISVDTNVLVRILVNDDPGQVKKARALVRRLDTEGESAHVSQIVTCEVAWVLAACYGFKREDIANALRQLTAARQLQFEQSDLVLRALRGYEVGRGDFADYLIRESARSAGCEVVATFDRKLHKEQMFVSP